MVAATVTFNPAPNVRFHFPVNSRFRECFGFHLLRNPGLTAVPGPGPEHCKRESRHAFLRKAQPVQCFHPNHRTRL